MNKKKSHLNSPFVNASINKAGIISDPSIHDNLQDLLEPSRRVAESMPGELVIQTGNHGSVGSEILYTLPKTNRHST